MAILRSLDGRFFEVPDDQVDRYLIPEDQVKAKLDAAGAPQVPPGPPGGGPGPGPGAPPPMIVVQVYGPPGAPGAPPPLESEQPAGGAEVQPYAYWNNWWHNRTGNWNNFWHNVHR
jgi:hypothetical protein